MELLILLLVLVVVLVIIRFSRYNKIGFGEIKNYYHGSRTKIKGSLKPIPSKILNGESAIFATNSRSVALMFIPKWTDNEIVFGKINGKLTAIENIPDAFSRFRISGYIYEIPSDQFHNDSRLGLQNIEFISNEPTKITKTEFISDVYDEIKKSGDIEFVKYGEKSNRQVRIHYLSFVNPVINGVRIDLIEAIQSGTKTVEGRLANNKTREMLPGDTIRFNYSDSGKSKYLEKRILFTHIYSGVREYLETETLDATLPIDWKKIKMDKSIESGIQIYNGFYKFPINHLSFIGIGLTDL